MPLRLRYVQDRDLWNFELVNTREFMAGVFQYPSTLAGFSKAMEATIPDLITEGGALLKARKTSLDVLVKNARRKNQVVAVVFAQAIGRILVHQAFFHRQRTQEVGVHAFAIV